jgi:dephospho-CoA kinase
MDLHVLCRTVLCVKAPFLIRLRRARVRDGLTVLQAIRRLAAQRGICPKRARRLVDTREVGNAAEEESLPRRLKEDFPDLDLV